MSNSPCPPSPGDETDRETIDALAQRVLFSDDLAEKLRPLPFSGSRTESGPKRISAPPGITPERPGDLKFATASAPRPKLPASAHLVTDENRGTLLHFFANHELLAAELMALALLRFPDAPHQFRVGLANTLREEQRHTRWYLKRMEECGVQFGEFPLSGFFWDAVSPMESPLDYVSRLSLTFEQANLDYAKYFSNVLSEAGDSKSAAILSKIYEDEISHVGYGLHWFRQWKDPSQNDWEALKSHLHFPLSPSRAKGNQTGFNEEGRRKAGFDEGYIRQLALFERSNGRTPNVFHFNPEAENAIAAFPAVYHPDKRICSVIADLEIVTSILARRDDVILLRRPPSLEHRAMLANHGLPLPEIETITPEASLPDDSLLRERRLNDFRPWSRMPQVAKEFSVLKGNTSSGSPAYEWKEADRDLFSKAKQIKILAPWGGLSFPCPTPELLAAGIHCLLEEGYDTAVIKRPFSTAGGGMKRINLREAAKGSGPVFSEKIRHESGLLLEPLHEREFDFSIQYEMKDGKLQQLGLVRQMIAGSGQYRGSLCLNKFCSGLPPEMAKFLMQEALLNYREGAPFFSALESWLRDSDYSGPLGVDAYLYRDQDGQLRLRTFCEVNPRYTMGRVACELRKKVSPGHGVKFEIIKRDPDIHYSNSAICNTEGAIESGSLILNEIGEDTRFLVKITIAKDAASL